MSELIVYSVPGRPIADPDPHDSFSLQASIGKEPDTQALRKLRVAFSPTLGAGKVDGECVGHSEMDAYGLDRLIVYLAQQRERLTKRVPMALEDGEGIRGQREPEWMCVFAKETDDQVLALRHAGLGWLGFQLSVKTARAMATALLNGSSRKLNEIIERRRLR